MVDRHAEIDEAIAFIQHHIYEPLPLARLASHVAYSPYHFERIFKDRVGLSPLYYVSALRLQKSKDLLLRTTLSVREIGLEIGQQSLGTFRISGVKPGRYYLMATSVSWGMQAGDFHLPLISLPLLMSHFLDQIHQNRNR